MKKFVITSLIGVLGIFSLLAQEKAMLEIRVNGLRNSEGKLSITLFNNEAGFPDDADKAVAWQTIDLSMKKPVFYFQDLPPGVYAYAILHDEDNDGEMKKNLFGIPKEGFGFSRNYSPRVKKPSFEDASVRLKEGKNLDIIDIIYFF